MTEHFIGLDIGTSAVKAVLFSAAQQLVAESEVAVQTSQPKPLWSEQTPDDWWQATQVAMAKLRDKAQGEFADVAAIGLSGQMHGAVCLDASNKPLRPAILWNDGRAAAECAALNASGIAVGDTAGVIAMPGFTAPKLMWLKAHEPALFKRIQTVLLPKDYIRLKLTGELATDFSDAAGTLWLDQGRRAWSPTMLEATGMTLDVMPQLLEGNEVSGTVRPVVSETLGIRADAIVAGGGGDAAAGAVGIGAINDGDAFISLGTSGQVFVSRSAYVPRPHELIHAFAHCLPSRWFQMACMLNGASCVAWAAKLVGESDIGALMERTRIAYRGPGDVVFLPYLSGERTPHNDPYAQGVLFGMRPESGPCDVVQAVLEGVSFSVRQCNECLVSAGTDCKAFAVIGGGARSPFWMQMLADVLGKRVYSLPGAEKGPAFGAARLSMMARQGLEAQDVCGDRAIAREFAPDMSLHERYLALYERFTQLYGALRPEFARHHAASAQWAMNTGT